MKIKSFLWVGLSTTLCASLAVAQLPPVVPLERSVQPAQEVKLNLNYQDVDVIDLLRKVSTEGNLAIVVRGDVQGMVEKIRLKNASPELALQKVVEEAGLDWKLVDHVYIVTPKTSLTPADQGVKRLELHFEEVDIVDLLQIISQNYGVKVSISPDVTGRLRLVHLKDRSAQEHIEMICKSVNLTCRKEGDTYLIAKSAG